MKQRLSKSMRMLLGHPNILGLHAALAAYQGGGAWLDEVLQYLEINRDYLNDFVLEELPGVNLWRPEGTFLGWLDCRELNLDTTPQTFFLEQAKVGLNDGATFGEGGEDFVRLNFACPKSVLEDGLTRMRGAVRRHQGV